MGSAQNDLRKFPREVRLISGFALWQAQNGQNTPGVKPLKGFGGRSVLEVIANHDGNSFRAVYTVKFAGIVYVLHAFQKKSKNGIKTPKHELDIIRARLKLAQDHYARHYEDRE